MRETVTLSAGIIAILAMVAVMYWRHCKRTKMAIKIMLDWFNHPRIVITTTAITDDAVPNELWPTIMDWYRRYGPLLTVLVSRQPTCEEGLKYFRQVCQKIVASYGTREGTMNYMGKGMPNYFVHPHELEICVR